LEEKKYEFLAVIGGKNKVKNISCQEVDFAKARVVGSVLPEDKETIYIFWE